MAFALSDRGICRGSSEEPSHGDWREEAPECGACGELIHPSTPKIRCFACGGDSFHDTPACRAQHELERHGEDDADPADYEGDSDETLGIKPGTGSY